MGHRELGAIVSIVVGLLFLDLLPRRVQSLSHDALKATFRALGIYFLAMAGAALGEEWGFLTQAEAGFVIRFGVLWVGAVVVIFGGADLYGWWSTRSLGSGR